MAVVFAGWPLSISWAITDKTEADGHLSLLSAALAPTMGPLERAKYTNPLRNATRSK